MKRGPITAALLTALALPAFAETVTYYLWDPVSRTYIERTLETPTPSPRVQVEPVPEAVYVAPDIVVTAPRTEDERIQDEVMERIATHPSMSGTIGVETFDRDVTLTGRVPTQGQMRIAAQEANSVPGVDRVTNLIRPQVGGVY